MPRRRPAIAGPVAVAALFLAVIGASVGFMLGAREKAGSDDGGRQDAGQVVNPTQPPAVTPTGDETPPEQPGTTGGTGPGGQTEEIPTKDRCPRHTEWLAKKATNGGLELKLYIRTDKSEVWICADSDGELYYQGHRGPPGERLIEGENALYLDSVAPYAGGYRATNRAEDGSLTSYIVDTNELEINQRSGNEKQPVVEHHP